LLCSCLRCLLPDLTVTLVLVPLPVLPALNCLQGLDFLAMAFLLLTWRECIAAWASVHYLPLLYMIAVLVLGNLFPVKSSKKGGKGRAAGAEGGSSREQQQQEAAEPARAAEPVSGDHLHLGEGYKSALVPSRPGSRPDLTNGVKQE
jgi:hypothetical protein